MPNTTPAKEVSDYVKSAVIYQLFLRPFTPEGTLEAATRMLPHVASLGVDIVYLCPQMTADDDPRTEFWSDRQNASKMDNPYSPYRIKDYFATDPEYGTDDDLRRFVTVAHSLGLLVMLDLVYYHCGPTAVFIEDHPDFVKRNEDGTVKNGRWHFPELNFDCPELREYLWKNMEYWIREFDADGYRCDVGSAIPLDFYKARARLFYYAVLGLLLVTLAAATAVSGINAWLKVGWGRTIRDMKNFGFLAPSSFAILKTTTSPWIWATDAGTWSARRN